MNIEKTMENLKKNRMVPYFVKTKEEALEKVRELLSPGDVVSVGGSVTLKQTGVMDLLRNGDYRFLDREEKGVDVGAIYREAFSADAFICSSNAITENGELYNVDGNGNRVAAMIFGPKSVIVVAGKNKIVRDIPEATKRLKTVAAPKNTKRLSCKTYCEETGVCMGADDTEMCAGCQSDGRICCAYTVLSHQRTKDRIKVILVDEELGY